METLQAIYIALAVFGVGVTIVDLFGALDHGGQDGGQDAGGHGSGHDGHDGHDLVAQAAHDAVVHGGHDGHDGHGGHESHDGQAQDGHPAAGAGTLPVAPPPRYLSEESESMRRSASLARVVGVLRLAVYFSLGAGPTGLAATAMRLSALDSFLWAAGAGLAIAVLARLLRRFLRRDLDSSLGPEDFILEEAEITVPIAPGLVGRALVRKYGTQSEVYVRATKGDDAYARGAKVRIIDFQDEVYLVEPADEEHLVR